MGWFDDDSQPAQAYNDYNNNYQDSVGSDDHQAKFSHELIGGAAAYEAAKAYEDHCNREGQPGSHEKAKEVLAGFVGAFVDREVETKGMDWVDREEAKRHGRRQAEQAYDDNGGQF